MAVRRPAHHDSDLALWQSPSGHVEENTLNVTVTYTIVEHDGGWAYRLGDVYSETFRSHAQALEAARRAALEQRQPGDTTGISWEDENGDWHEEVARGDDRPVTHVKP
jgi:hypothetical protein